MNKSELINAIASKAGLTAVDTAKVVDAFMGVVQETLSQGDKVALTGFGVFEVREKAAREGFNPKTGERIAIAACKAPAFKAGKTFKDSIK